MNKPEKIVNLTNEQKKRLNELLMPIVASLKDTGKAANVSYRIWDHSYYGIEKKFLDNPDGKEEQSLRFLELFYGMNFFQAAVIQDQWATSLVAITEFLNILHEAGAIDEPPKLPTCQVGPDGRPVIGGSC